MRYICEDGCCDVFRGERIAGHNGRPIRYNGVWYPSVQALSEADEIEILPQTIADRLRRQACLRSGLNEFRRPPWVKETVMGLNPFAVLKWTDT